ncbi:MAG TPA: bifunctional phosphoribosyl-AMP cyclohydrolase/phosphoribosyl-ATP diphosphatase HisIE [Steroidobacteraceae bacterium]|nr:bifunctional phosphoribosyl-AMP cyclohydrolase/phosphoribosyl-ATP diphosphatase HisIE [Steroidobacteraceae bacterium]
MNFTEADIDRIDWKKSDGLVPAVAQHNMTGAVLMLGYMNQEALKLTLQRGRVVFFSRTRGRLWEKGEQSGNTLRLVDLRLDCDVDALLVTAMPTGPVCHLGTQTCFGNEAITDGERLAFLLELEQLIGQRISEKPDGSYTAQLFEKGMRRMAQKVGEEGVEVALAAVTEPDDPFLGECADLLYHLLVLLRARSLRLDTVVEEMKHRHADRNRR